MKLSSSTTLMLGLTSLTILSGLVLTSTKASADNDSVTDDVEITVPIACTMSGNIATGQEHTASLSPGTYSAASGSDYENGIGTTTLTTFCNDNNGFSVYAIGFTDDTAGNNTLVGTSASNNATISTDTYTPGDTTSSWSMKVDKVTDTTTSYNPTNMTIDNSFDNYHAVPDEYTRVAHYQASTGPSTTDTTLGAKLTTTYAAFISQTQAADTYQGQVKYVMVHPYSATDENKPTSSLCALNQLVMQNVSQWQSSVASGNEVTACDNRDGKTYTVARLADGNLWMTQNLDHDIVTDGSVAYDSTTTDLPTNMTWVPERATYASNVTHWNETGVDGYFHPESYDPGDLYINPVYIEYLNTDEADEPSLTVSDVAESDSHYHLGNYYNWSAAVAVNDSSSYNSDTTLVEQSICPAGWTLPRAGTGDDSFGALWSDEAYGFDYVSFNDLNSNYYWDSNESALWTNPLFFAPTGSWKDGYLHDISYYGLFWSPVVNDRYRAYFAYFEVNGEHCAYTNLDNPRYDGYSIRCVARPVSSSVSGL